MRFRFCGDQDCPDWLLAEISTLSKLTSVKMKLLSTQVVKDMLGDKIDFEKVAKLTADAKFESGDVKATVAAINSIVSSAAKFNVEGDTLSNELQQLGLPKELASAICKVYTDYQDKLKEDLRKKSLRLNSYDSVDWRVDYIVSSSKLQDVSQPCVQLKLKSNVEDSQESKATVFSVPSDKFSLLLSDLKQAHNMMEGI